VVVKVGYLSTLALYHLRVRQYSYALEVFAFIFELYRHRSVDYSNEVFLSALSNYLCFLRKAGRKVTSRRLEVEQALRDLFFKFITKFMLIEKETPPEAQVNILALLGGLLNQHGPLLEQYEKDLNAMIRHFYQQSGSGRFKLPDNMLAFIMRNRVRKSLIFGIQLNPEELLFYSASIFRSQRPRKKQEPEQLTHMEAMMSQTIEILQEQKLASTRYTAQQQQSARSHLNTSTIDSSKPHL
jgi:hypothetical protein